MWGFCLRSLCRGYGWRFIGRVAARHPWRTLKALRGARRIDAGAAIVHVGRAGASGTCGGPPSIVGAGFCLKPVEPPCPSGRANHDCGYLETLALGDAAPVPAACRACTIRDMGTKALQAGSAFYVMTSARDILDDVYVPAIEAGRFPTGLFVLCRYSLKPFAVGLVASGMSARMLPLASGDCRDYQAWLLADRGVKPEQTTVDAVGLVQVARTLAGAAPARAARFERSGNVLHPIASGSPA